jgi:hypothetical protein
MRVRTLDATSIGLTFETTSILSNYSPTSMSTTRGEPPVDLWFAPAGGAGKLHSPT